MSTPGHKPASNPLATYSFPHIEEYDDDDEEEECWSEDEEFHSEDVDFNNDYDYDSDTDDHDYFEDEEDKHDRNDYDGGPGYFYPEQLYSGPPVVPKPSLEASSSKLRYYVLSPISDIARIYIKFAILAILVYVVALWYTVHYGDLDAINDIEEDDVDTCPASLSA